MKLRLILGLQSTLTKVDIYNLQVYIIMIFELFQISIFRVLSLWYQDAVLRESCVLHIL